MSKLTPIIKESMVQYAGAVLQSRALVDARDCLKPSARQIFYCLYDDKFTSDKPFKKTLKAIGSAMRMYIHGDSSCEGIIMRASQGFAMRYPLIDVEGNNGNIMLSGNWAASRYTSARLAPIANNLFEDIEKETIDEWRDNYDDTEQYPMSLPSKGFYNIVNGAFGIGVGAASSIPQFNIVDVNNALIKLLWGEDSFEELYCAPDFATGGILLNEAEVKESLKKGTGYACKLRSVIEFDSKERCLVITEIPFGVYTNTICGELEKLLEDDDNPGIDKFNDLSGVNPLIKIYLSKKANPDKVIKFLYKNTSLQSFYSINMTMLENGRYPKVYPWVAALRAHLEHEKIVYRRGFEFDLKKIEKRLHIIDGLLIALASINEVIQTIKSSSSTKEANENLQKNFLLDEVQAKAILDMKLSRLAKLEVKKLTDEKAELEREAERLHAILKDENLLKKEIENGLAAVAKKYGDEHRTKILNIESEDDEPTEIRSLQLSLSNKNNIYLSEVSSLYTQKRGGVGNKIKLEAGEYIKSSISIESNDTVLFFMQNGNYYHYNAAAIPIGERMPAQALFAMEDWENICAVASLNKKSEKENILFFTKKGIVKKSLLSEYNTKRSTAMKALNLDPGDEITSVIFTNKEKVGLLTEMGNFVIIETDDIRPIGRVARGVKAMKLNDGDYIISGRPIPAATKFIVSVSGEGLIKKTPYSEFTVQGKNTKGAKLQKLTDGDWMADFMPLAAETEILVNATTSCIKMNVNEIPEFGRGAQGNKAIKLTAKNNVVGLS